MPENEIVTHPIFGDVTNVPADIIMVADQQIQLLPQNRGKDKAQKIIDDYKNSDDFKNNGGSQVKKVEADPENTDKKDDKSGDDKDDKFADIVNPYLKTKLKKDNGGGDNKLEVKTLDELNKIIKEKYNINDVPTFIDAFEKNRTNSQQGNKFKQELENLNNGLNSLPKPIQKGLMSFWGGKPDYMKDFTENTIDFNKPFDTQDKKALLAHYMPEVKDDIDFSDTTDKQAIIASKSLQTLYENDVKRTNEELSSSAKQVKDRLNNLTVSRETSVRTLNESLPDLDSDKKGRISKILNSNDLIRDLGIFDKDGNFTNEAASRIYWMLYGQENTDDAFALFEAQKKQLENSVTKKSDTLPKKGAGGELSDNNDEDAMKEIERITGLKAPRNWKQKQEQK